MDRQPPSKRERLRAAFTRLGLTELRWRTLGRGLYCFNYHRIGCPLSCEFDRGVYSCTAAHFREHVRLIKERFEVVDIAKLTQARAGRRTGRPWALITFDDGYADNFEVAFPILKELGVTAAFFIPTAFIGGSRLPWWDEIAWSLRNATVGRIRLAGAEGEFALDGGRIERTIRAVLRLVKCRSETPMEEQVAEIREASRPAGSLEEAGAGLFAGREALIEMRRAGMDIGSHTHSHRILSHLDADSQRDELEQSKAILEALLGEPVPSVAYPVGSSSAYGPETCRIAESLGYRVGFNFIPGINRLPLARPFNVNRLAVEDDPGPEKLRLTAGFPWL